MSDRLPLDAYDEALRRNSALALGRMATGQQVFKDPRVSVALAARDLPPDATFLCAADLLAALRQHGLIAQRTQPLSTGDLAARGPLVQLVNRFDTHLKLNAAPLVRSQAQGWALRFHLGRSGTFPLPVFIALRYHLHRLGYRQVAYEFQNGCEHLVDPFRQVPWASGLADVNVQQ